MLILAIVTALCAVAGVVYAGWQARTAAHSLAQSEKQQARDRAEFYGRLTAVVEGLAEGQKRHDREIEAIKTTQGRHGNAIAVLHERLRSVDTGVPGVNVGN